MPRIQEFILPLTREKNEVQKAVKREVEHYFSNMDIDVSWPWSDFTYTCDWGCYTEVTRIDYKQNGVFHDDDRVYAEVYKDGSQYEVCLLTVANKVIIDTWDQVNSENKDMFFNNRTYISATELMNKGNYEEAYDLFISLGSFDDSQSQATKCLETLQHQIYDQAMAYKNESKYADAAELFNSIASYSDSAEQVDECYELIKAQQYEKAISLQASKDYEAAIAIFEGLADYSDSSEKIIECQQAILKDKYEEAMAKMSDGSYEDAIAIFEEFADYSDSSEKIVECQQAILEEKYQNALAKMSDGSYEDAIALFTELNGYSDSEKQIEKCSLAILDRDYQAALLKMNDGEYENAISMFKALNGYSDSNEKIKECENAINQSTYEKALKLIDNGQFTSAIDVLISLKDFPGAAEKAEEVQDILSLINRTIQVENAEYTLFQGKNLKLEAVVSPLSESAPTDTKIVFSTNDKDIVNVAANGTVTGKNAGDSNVRISAADNPYIFTDITIHVVKSVNQINLDSRSAELFIPVTNGNDKIQLNYSIAPEDAYNKSVVWTSSNESVATVSSDGLITAVGTGRANITATCEDDSKGKKSATCNVVVSQAATAVTLNDDSGTVVEGKQLQIKASVEPSNAKNKKLTWSSSNERVATVSANGQVKGISTGTAIITASSADGPSAEYYLTVEQDPANRPFIISFNDFKSRFSKAVSKSGSKHKLPSNATTDEGINDVTTYYLKDNLALQLSFPHGTKHVRSALVIFAPDGTDSSLEHFLDLCGEMLYATKVTESFDSMWDVLTYLDFYDNLDNGDSNTITINNTTVGYSISSMIGVMFYVEAQE